MKNNHSIPRTKVAPTRAARRNIMLVFIILAGANTGAAQGDWRQVYSEDFSTDPQWITNNPSHYYWDSNTENYFANQFNIPNGGEYAHHNTVYAGGSFRLEWDITVEWTDYASVINFGMFEDDMQTQEGSCVVVQFVTADGGKYVTLYAFDSDGSSFADNSLPWRFSTGAEHRVILEYSVDDATIEANIYQGNTLEASLVVSGLGTLSPGMTRIGTSNVRRYGFQCPGCDSAARVDDVVLSVPEPPNQPPNCNAGGPYTAECEEIATNIPLDGSGSSDPDGDPLTFLWTTECPGGSFDDETADMPILTLDAAPECDMSCNVTLAVDDGNGGTDSCSAMVTISDTQAPFVNCWATALNGHRMLIEYSGEDACGEVTASAVIETQCCPVPVVDGQIFKLKCGQHEECKLDIDFERDTFKIKTDGAALVVTATDGCGNEATCELELCVSDDDDDYGHDGDDDD